MPAFPPRPQRRMRHRAGAGLPLLTTCADVDAYQKELGAAVESFNVDLSNANAFADQSFAARWFKFYGDWEGFDKDECHWYSWDDSPTGMGYRIDHLMTFHDALAAFEAEAKANGVTASKPLPDAPTGPSLTDPGKEGDTFGKTVRIAAIAGAVIAGSWAVVTVAKMFHGDER